MRGCLLALAASSVIGCGSGRPAATAPGPAVHVRYNGGDAALSRAADTAMIAIPRGASIEGSTRSERDNAYDAYRTTAGHNGARTHNWFEREADRKRITVPAYRIDLAPVTMAAYAEFVVDTGEPPPAIDEATWKKQGFNQRYPEQVIRFNWVDGQVPEGREEHPVVLVTWAQAQRYCAWRGAVVGEPRRLPTASEFERAARGNDGSIYPWGPTFEPDKLNSAVAGPKDTVPVGSHPSGASPFGLLDAAGNVFQWTSTAWPHRKDAMTVKGSAWDDFGGLGRGAARHGRVRTVKHVIVGFRCAATGH